jgi:hypothetical protein
MKQMIACAACAQRKIKDYPGEYWKRVHGIAKKDMRCDWCYPAAEIKKGDPCAAETLGVVGHGIPYHPWESEYIEIKQD